RCASTFVLHSSPTRRSSDLVFIIRSNTDKIGANRDGSPSKCPSTSATASIVDRQCSFGFYRIRKEPKEHCLSTIEAVALVLGHFEGDPSRFAPILSVFDRIIKTRSEERRVGEECKTKVEAQ